MSGNCINKLDYRSKKKETEGEKVKWKQEPTNNHAINSRTRSRKKLLLVVEIIDLKEK